MSAVARFILDSQTPEQHEIHDVEGEEDEISSYFHVEPRKMMWSAHLPQKVQSSPEGTDGAVTYTFDNTAHFLLYTVMHTSFPAIRVKKEYEKSVQICWPHNLGSSQVVGTSFKVSEKTLQSFDNHWYNIYGQFFLSKKPGVRSGHNRSLGNLECLEKWTVFLPAYTTEVDQPYWYNNGPPFPIFFADSTTPITQNYTFRLSVASLLRMRVLKNGSWRELAKVNFRFLEGVEEKSKIPIPELWAHYGYGTSDLLDWFKECIGEEKAYYIRDVVSCDTANTNVFGTAAEINLHCDMPCLAMFWMAENMDATAKRCYSNYTTDDSDLYRGWDPIAKNTLKHGVLVHLPDMNSIHFSNSEARHHFSSIPKEIGYHAYSFAGSNSKQSNDPGMVFIDGKSILIAQIRNNDIFLATPGGDKEEDDEPDEPEREASLSQSAPPTSLSSPPPLSPRFLTRVRLLLLSRFFVRRRGPDKFEFSLTPR